MTRAPVVEAQPGKFATLRLTMVNVPLPLESAAGIVVQPGAPVAIRSVLPSPLRSPATTWTCAAVTQEVKVTRVLLVTENLPSPLENATGTVFHPEPPVSATSALPSPL